MVYKYDQDHIMVIDVKECTISRQFSIQEIPGGVINSLQNELAKSQLFSHSLYITTLTLAGDFAITDLENSILRE